jgi:hypothetical protein
MLRLKRMEMEGKNGALFFTSTGHATHRYRIQTRKELGERERFSVGSILGCGNGGGVVVVVV